MEQIANTVSLHGCPAYDLEQAKAALQKVFEDLGGIARFVKPNSQVLLKPNLLLKKSPDKMATTHPVFVEAVVRLVQQAGGIVTIADSPGGLYTHAALKSVYAGCGMEEVARRTGATLNYNLADRDTEIRGEIPNHRAKIIEPYFNHDVVITLSKIKTHCMTYYTGAVKNLFGLIPGVHKAQYHYKFKEKNDFCNMLVDLCEFAKPALSLMDGVVGMEGNGPSNGRPRKIGVVMGSVNPYALDMAACALIGIQGEKDVLVLKNAVRRGLAPEKLEDILIVGEPLKSYFVKDFKMPDTASHQFGDKVPKVVARWLEKGMYPFPSYSKNRCVCCGKCVAACPPKALTIKGSDVPLLNKELCIKCYCCQELCPENAVRLRKIWLLKFIK